MRGKKVITEKPKIRMIDVGEKKVTRREAEAACFIRLKPRTLEMIQQGKMEKGDVLAAAELAGIAGAKRCPELVPLCHPVPIEHVSVKAEMDPEKLGIKLRAVVRGEAKTGYEMEALTAVAGAALTIYDMCKPVEPGMVIESIRLLRKSGGKSGKINFA